MARFGRPWFDQRLYGYGAFPNTWQGWLATVGLIVAVVAVAHRLMTGVRYGLLTAVVVGFTVLAWGKTEGGWRWRWGPDS